MRRQKPIPLSACIDQKTQIKNKRLALPARNINTIDQINPYISSEIESLSLQQNRISSLKGIQQFSFLKQLDLSQNKIQKAAELLNLKELYHLTKIYLSNNPFLNQPIPEEVLDFILDKETDIEILSFQILSSLRDVEEREIKIIFLKNYIQKIDLHSELKNKNKIVETNKQIEAQQILKKIVPQFYTLIEDPKLINKIKVEALTKKKKSQETIQQVLQQTKHQKEEKIDSLIKNIVQLLHHNSQFKKSNSFVLEVNLDENTITFSPQRKRQISEISLSQEFSPVRHIEASKDDASIEDLTLNHFKPPPKPNTNIKPFTATNYSHTKSIKFDQSSNQRSDKMTSNLDNLETARKSSIKTISQKMKEHNQFKQTYQSEIRKIKDKQSLDKFPNSSSKQKQAQHKDPKPATPKNSKNDLDVNKIKKKPMQSSQSYAFIKVIQENQEESIENRQIQGFNRISEQFNSVKNHKNQFSNNSYHSSMEMSPQGIQTIYFKTLSKINPMFALLLSPSTSLKTQQKSQLLESLKSHHKEQFIELLKEKHNNQQLMKQLSQTKDNYGREIESIITNNKNIYHQYINYKEQFQWIGETHRELQSKYQEVAIKFRDMEMSEKKKTIAVNILEANYKKLKQAYSEKQDRLDYLQAIDEKEEKIKSKRQVYIKNKYLSLIKAKGSLWSEILAKNKSNKVSRQKQLIKWGMESFIFNRRQSKSLQNKIKFNQTNILREHFNEWKMYKQLQKKQKLVIKKVSKCRSSQIISLLKRNEASSKLNKLKNIWAKRFFIDRKQKQSMLKWKHFKEECKKNNIKALNYNVKNIKKTIFFSLKEIVSIRRQYVDQILQKRLDRLRAKQIKRMLYIMHKQTAQIEEKQRKLSIARQKNQRQDYFNRFKITTKKYKLINSANLLLKTKLKNKNFSFFKKIIKMSRQKCKKLANLTHLLHFRIFLKMIIRQKSSNTYSNILMKKLCVNFFKNMRQKYDKQLSFVKKQQKMTLLTHSKVNFLKLKFIKQLQVCKLKGKNYVKYQTIRQMNFQMNLNDRTAIELVKMEKQEITKCEKQIYFLKNQIQSQSMREMALLRQKDEMMLSISQSYDIMVELRREIDSIRQQYVDQQAKYNTLVGLYNEVVANLRNKEEEYLKLYHTFLDK